MSCLVSESKKFLAINYISYEEGIVNNGLDFITLTMVKRNRIGYTSNLAIHKKCEETFDLKSFSNPIYSSTTILSLTCFKNSTR